MTVHSAPTHVLDVLVERDPSGDGNLTKRTPICSCGWKGFGIQDYNDDQFTRMRKQEREHMRLVMMNCDW